MSDEHAERAWILWIVVVSATTAGLEFFYVGPARWLGDAELQWLGRQYGYVSVVLMSAPLLVLGFAVKSTAPGVYTTVGRALDRPWLWPFRRAWAALLLTTLMASTVADHAFAPELGRLSVAEALGRSEGAFYAQVTGFLEAEGLVIDDDGTSTSYLGFTESPGALPIGMVVSGSQRELERAVRTEPGSDRVMVEGFVDGRFPGDAAAWYPAQTGRALGASPRILRPKIDRRTARRFLFGVLGVGLGVGAFFAYKDRPSSRSASS